MSETAAGARGVCPRGQCGQRCQRQLTLGHVYVLWDQGCRPLQRLPGRGAVAPWESSCSGRGSSLSI